MPTLTAKHKAPRPTPTLRQETPAPKQHQSRESAHKRGYTRAWYKASKAYLQHHPLCVKCLAENHVRQSTEVDHIIPHRGDMKLFWDSENNWQALCKPHHSAKTVAEDGGFGRARKQHHAEP